MVERDTFSNAGIGVLITTIMTSNMLCKVQDL